MKRTGQYRIFPRRSLLSRYLLIIIVALLFIPVFIPLLFLGYNIFASLNQGEPAAEHTPYSNISELEVKWHQEAQQLLGQEPEAIDERLGQLSTEYPLAGMFWVDGKGTTRVQLSSRLPELKEQAIPLQWSPADAIAFMKKSAARDPLAIVAFIGDKAEAGEGFMVMQIPESVQGEPYLQTRGFWYMVLLLLLFAGFVVVSLLYFISIRRRLLRLQTAMRFTDTDRLPQLIALGRQDEIGQLEEAFNTMVLELGTSRTREAEEEGLRKRLVADLSHDLRTPLTVIRSHLHVLGREELSPRGQESLVLMDQRIDSLGVLIENLLSYNLLTSGRITLNLERRDVLRLLRESAAAWYPLWEKEGFEIEMELEAAPLYWMVDDSWFRRVLDNLFQNILRHARIGKYVAARTEIRGGKRVIVIADRGAGLNGGTDSKGAGLGLSIVDLLLKRMELEWSMQSTGKGTEIVIWSRQQDREILNKI
ncbi:HAMP domain-containing sensor histidine kinase [Paenibacillus sp. MMS20-IR301]|uniref:sensor histidine kinase n=1 Tax=Paenibacillus sp. MMS20-IR301 TaxID=2895946 RepID=UPI0028EB116B|nr:HAMP domain-containing sensor histidine kinase [Paenibacillus sp. MMS20-IR301]WNS41839.1 HAMP domain-containing sensor histidine kinase [Paenibacillus sp. MMS20-IR301]